MTIDKELFYASHGLKYPVVARCTNDMEVKEKFYTEADLVAMLEELKSNLDREIILFGEHNEGDIQFGVSIGRDLIQQKINALKAEKGEEDDK